MTLSINPPFPTFQDVDGKPLENGFIYIGAENLDPQVNPIAVYWDAGLTQLAAQPIRTNGGYPVNSGTPVRIYVGVTYSIRVMDKKGRVVYSSPSDTLFLDASKVSFTQSGASAVPRSVEGKLDDVVSVKDNGAVCDNATDDAAAVTSSIADYAGKPIEVIDTSLVKASATSPFFLGNLTGNLVYPAVLFSQSNVEIVGGTAHIVSRTSPATSDIQPAYSTLKNMTLGTQQNITFRNHTIDVVNDADAANSNQRGMYMVGVRGLRYLQTRGISSGTRRGYFSHIQNSADVIINGHYHSKVTGGFNFRYTNGIVLTSSVFNDFSEAVDFDGTATAITSANLIFKGTARTQQCFDVNSVQLATIGGVVVETAGNIANISYKNTTPPNFADYVNNVAPSSLTPTQDVVMRGVVGRTIGDTSNKSFVIGNDWAGNPHDGFDPVNNIIIGDVRLRDTSGIKVWEGNALTLSEIHLSSVLGSGVGEAAIDMQSAVATNAQIAWSDLDARVIGASVIGADRGAFRATNPSYLYIDGLEASGVDTLGTGVADVLINGLQQRGGTVVVDGLRIDGNVQFTGDATAIPAWVGSSVYVKNMVRVNGGLYYRCIIGGTAAGAGGPTGRGAAIVDGTVTWRWQAQPYEIVWGNRNKVGGDIVFGNDAHNYIQGQTIAINIGDLAATGTVNRVAYTATRRCRVARATYSVAATFGADAVNFRSFLIRSVQNGGAASTVAQINTQAGFTAYTAINGGFANVEAGAILNPGDVMFFESTASGTGRAITGLSIMLEVLGM